LLRREVIPTWGRRSVHELTKRQVIDLVTEIAARGTPATANKLLKVVKTFFGWCVGHAILELSPAKGVAAPARERARDRVLDDKELARIIRLLGRSVARMEPSSNSWPGPANAVKRSRN
jgi:site-specific recombinase XerC